MVEVLLPGVYDIEVTNELDQLLPAVGWKTVKFGDDAAEVVTERIDFFPYQTHRGTDLLIESISDQMWNLIDTQKLRLMVNGERVFDRNQPLPDSNPLPPVGDLPGLALAFAHMPVKVTAAYTGPCMRIRRDADDLEQDIPFKVDGSVDVDAIGRFCSTTVPVSNGHIAVYYDQSGNGMHATSPMVNQPKVYDSQDGLLLGYRNLPAPHYDEVDDYLQSPATVAAAALRNGQTILCVFNQERDKTCHMMSINETTYNFSRGRIHIRRPSTSSNTLQYDPPSGAECTKNVVGLPYYDRNAIVMGTRPEGTDTLSQLIWDGVVRDTDESSNGAFGDSPTQVTYGSTQAASGGFFDGVIFGGIAWAGDATPEQIEQINVYFTILFGAGQPLQ